MEQSSTGRRSWLKGKLPLLGSTRKPPSSTSSKSEVLALKAEEGRRGHKMGKRQRVCPATFPLPVHATSQLQNCPYEDLWRVMWGRGIQRRRHSMGGGALWVGAQHIGSLSWTNGFPDLDLSLLQRPGVAVKVATRSESLAGPALLAASEKFRILPSWLLTTTTVSSGLTIDPCSELLGVGLHANVCKGVAWKLYMYR